MVKKLRYDSLKSCESGYCGSAGASPSHFWNALNFLRRRVANIRAAPISSTLVPGSGMLRKPTGHFARSR